MTTPTWNPVPISQLQPVSPPDSWLWQGLIAPSRITLLCAEAKAGKTTLLSMLFKRMESGGSLCGAPVQPGRVIVVTEEHTDIWIERRDRFGLTDNVRVLSTPFLSRPTQTDWERLLARAEDALKTEPAELIVFDTLTHLWPVTEENDNGMEATALMPLRRLGKDLKTAQQLVHHFGSEKKGPRGGTELRAFPDMLIDFHLYTPDDFQDRRRKITTKGRLLPYPTSAVVKLNDTGDDYAVLEGSLTTGSISFASTLQDILPTSPPGFSWQECHDAWPPPKPAPERLRKHLDRNWQSSGWHRTGAGIKGDPYRYFSGGP
jgi:hypothetical protein